MTAFTVTHAFDFDYTVDDYGTPQVVCLALGFFAYRDDSGVWLIEMESMDDWPVDPAMQRRLETDWQGQTVGEPAR